MATGGVLKAENTASRQDMILDVSDITVDEESHGTISVRYKNLGKTPATFHVSCDAPDIGGVLSLPPNKTLEPGETTTQTIVLGGATVDEDRTGLGKVTVTAVRTNYSDTEPFVMTVKNVEVESPKGIPLIWIMMLATVIIVSSALALAAYRKRV